MILFNQFVKNTKMKNNKSISRTQLNYTLLSSTGNDENLYIMKGMIFNAIQSELQWFQQQWRKSE